jgi:hypothetical protein
MNANDRRSCDCCAGHGDASAEKRNAKILSENFALIGVVLSVLK